MIQNNIIFDLNYSMMSFKEIMELMTSNTLTPDIPVPVDPDF